MLLGIDTCSILGTIALVSPGSGELSDHGQIELPGKTYSEQLVPAIARLLEQAGITAAALQCVVAVSGPGSFTGVRIGLSTAKGLCEALAIPLVPVSRLAVLAATANLRVSALDAGRGEFYVGAYLPHRTTEILLNRDQLAAALPSQEPVAVCDESVRQAIRQAVFCPQPTAADALRYAYPRLADLRRDLAAIDGNYLRRSDAEIFAQAPAAAGTRLL